MVDDSTIEVDVDEIEDIYKCGNLTNKIHIQLH